MTIYYDVQISDADWKDIQQELWATEKELNAAVKRAIRKVSLWLKRQIARGISRETGIAQKALRARLHHIMYTRRDLRAVVWLGLNAVPAHLTGTPRQSARGVRVAKRSYPGAFHARVYGEEQKVWIRRASKHFDPQLYPYNKRSSRRWGALSDEQAGRFPVVLARVPIKDVGERVAEREYARVDKRLLTLIRQELNFEIFVKGENVRFAT